MGVSDGLLPEEQSFATTGQGQGRVTDGLLLAYEQLPQRSRAHC